MRVQLHFWRLPLAHTFTISRESLQHQRSLVVELEHEGVVGYGEVTESPYYGHSLQSMADKIRGVEARLSAYHDQAPGEIWPRLMQWLDGDSFAASAVDIAAHDWWGKRQKVPTWKTWGWQWDQVPESSYTIGIDSIETMLDKWREQPNWSHYKIKLGTAHDLEVIERLRAVSSAVFRVDANCAWDAETTITMSRALADLGVEFIEQPLPPSAPLDEKRRVMMESALPIVADEDCQVAADVETCHGLYHGINIKLCKCGGLSPAVAMLTRAKELGLKTMVGCMVESSIGISGAAQLLPQLDYADLDGAVLLADEPAFGVRVENGKVHGADQPGNSCGIDIPKMPGFLLPAHCLSGTE